METTLQQRLSHIEKEHSIKILYACESGSRAWGFPSPDSDYDVRFIYVRTCKDYLSIKRRKDQLSFPINDELDIDGWDLVKVLQLIAKSNTTPFEWLQSPQIYSEEENFKEELWQVCQHYFCPRSNINHYLGIAHGAMETKIGDEIKIKKLFYILRPLLAALWCAKRNTIAPMSIYPLMELMSSDIQDKVLTLMKFKETAKESFLIHIDPDIQMWIDETFDYCKEVLQHLDKKNFDTTELDTFFRKHIRI